MARRFYLRRQHAEKGEPKQPAPLPYIPHETPRPVLPDVPKAKSDKQPAHKK